MLTTILVHLIIANGPYSITIAKSKAALAEASVRYEQELGITLKASNITILKRDPSRHFNNGVSPMKTQGRYFKMLQYIKLRHWTSSKVVKVVIAPPAFYQGGIWVYELSASSSYKTKGCIPLSFIAATGYNAKAEDRYPHAIVSIEHGLGHVFGASHDDSESPPTIMHPNALFFVTPLLPDWLRFGVTANQQISKYLSSKQL